MRIFPELILIVGGVFRTLSWRVVVPNSLRIYSKIIHYSKIKFVLKHFLNHVVFREHFNMLVYRHITTVLLVPLLVQLFSYQIEIRQVLDPISSRISA